MKKYSIISLRDDPARLEQAAQWFHRNWGIPAAAYRESMQACIRQRTGVPQWYLVCNEKKELVAGAGVIENDFHDRKELRPNLCALFVEETCRRQGIARSLLDFARNDMAQKGIDKLYLVTDHTAFYEKCGWEFLTIVRDEAGQLERMYMALTGSKEMD